MGDDLRGGSRKQFLWVTESRLGKTKRMIFTHIIIQAVEIMKKLLVTKLQILCYSSELLYVGYSQLARLLYAETFFDILCGYVTNVIVMSTTHLDCSGRNWSACRE